MSDLNRLQDETHDEAHPVVSSATDTAASTVPADGPIGDRGNETGTAADGGAPGANGEAPRKKRRRGTRGGQRRKKPAGAGGAGGARSSGGADTDDPDDTDDDNESMSGSEDWTAESADRGLTDDDIGEQAREDAGLTRPAVSRPKIGDSRPAPAATAPEKSNGADAGEPDADGGPKKRRRRRGGRGRSKGGAAGVGNGAGAGSAPARSQNRSGGGGQGRGPVQYVDAGELGDVDVDGTALLDSLDDETLQRRRGTSRKGRPAGRYLMVVHVREDGFAHIGVLEGRQLIEHYISTPTDENTSIDGNIYLGRVQNVLPGMEAAFIDIGTPKNGVLYRGDVAYDPNDVEGGEKPRIERVLRNGQAIIVQVTKNPIAHKGARLTQEVSLAGRFVVMVPGQPQTYGISKRLPDDERKRLRRVLDRLRPADAGLIVRTAAEGATEEELERDMLRLNAQWQQISEIAKKAKAGSLLYKEPQLAIRLIREEFTKEFRGVVIDNAAMYEEVNGYILSLIHI